MANYCTHANRARACSHQVTHLLEDVHVVAFVEVFRASVQSFAAEMTLG